MSRYDIKSYVLGVLTKSMPLEDIPVEAIPEVEGMLSKMADALAAGPAMDETTLKSDDELLVSPNGQWALKSKKPKENTLDYSSFNKPKPFSEYSSFNKPEPISEESAGTIDYSGKEPKVSGPQWKSSDVTRGSKTAQLPSNNKGALKRQRVQSAIDRGEVIDDRPKKP